MTAHRVMQMYNARAQPVQHIPLFPTSQFRERIVKAVRAGARLVSFFGRPVQARVIRLSALLAYDTESKLYLLETDVRHHYPSLTPDCPQAAFFEREIFEQWNVTPDGHPWLKPLRFQSGNPKKTVSSESDPSATSPGKMDFYQMEGLEIHEVAVGPVHAGVIEPGHFRFQCSGEKIMHLEISLGYQHRGIERALINGPDKRTMHYIETLAGDTTIGHATAYCQSREAMAGVVVSARAQALRAIALEMERLANHTGDLGAMAGDIGYLPTASFCGRLRGDFLNLTAILCGNRFGRNFICPGGVLFDLSKEQIEALLKGVTKIYEDVKNAIALLWSTPSVMARFEGTGILKRSDAERLGMVGPIARACGIERDVRFEFPSGLYTMTHIPIATWKTGDVFARAYVRWQEIQRSVAFIVDQLHALPKGKIVKEVNTTSKEQVVISLVEGWRGEICHTAITDKQGRFVHYKIVDPSFHNWQGLALAMRDQEISDFPLCNKSFNLSYCGHDL